MSEEMKLTEKEKQTKLKERIKNGELYIKLDKYGTPSEANIEWRRKMNHIRSITAPAYDFQEVRKQLGNKICATFYNKLGFEPGEKTKKEVALDAINSLDEITDEEKIEKEKFDFIEYLKTEYKRITDVLVGKEKKEKKKIEKFTKRTSTIITEEAEMVMIRQYIETERAENEMFKLLEKELAIFGNVSKWLLEQYGVKERLAGYLLSYLDPYRAPHASCFHSYCGLGVETNGKGTSMGSKVIREYIDKKGKVRLKESIKFQKDVKSKLVTCVQLNFIKKTCSRRKRFEDLITRYSNRPDLKGNKKHIYAMAIRVLCKDFLTELWVVMRQDQGLPVTEPYHVAKLGLRDHSKAA